LRKFAYNGGVIRHAPTLWYYQRWMRGVYFNEAFTIREAIL